jgi:hypothetical protein
MRGPSSRRGSPRRSATGRRSASTSPDFTRYPRSQRAQARGQALGLPLTMTAFAFIGVVVTSATLVVLGEAVWDPVELISRIGSPAVVVFGALIVMVAQISTNMAANVVSPANDFSHLSPRRISYVAGGLITAVFGVLIMPWKLYSDAGSHSSSAGTPVATAVSPSGPNTAEVTSANSSSAWRADLPRGSSTPRPKQRGASGSPRRARADSRSR